MVVSRRKRPLKLPVPWFVRLKSSKSCVEEKQGGRGLIRNKASGRFELGTKPQTLRNGFRKLASSSTILQSGFKVFSKFERVVYFVSFNLRRFVIGILCASCKTNFTELLLICRFETAGMWTP